MSTFDDKMSSIFSVHCTEEGSQSTFFRATLRLRTCVRRRWVFERSQRIFATELPTVPKPRRATLQVWAPAPVALDVEELVIVLLSPKLDGGCADCVRVPTQRPAGLNLSGHQATCCLKDRLGRTDTEAVRILTAHAPPPHLECGDVDRHDEELAVDVGPRRLKRPDAMPGMLRALEKQAAVLPQVQGGRNLQVVEARSRVGFVAPLAVENQDVASPLARPVFVGGEEEDVSCELAPGIAVRRNGAALPSVIPLHRKNDFLVGSQPQHPAQEGIVGLSLQFGNKFLPRLGTDYPFPVVQDATIVRGLPVCSLDAYPALELRNVGKSLAELVPTFVR